MVLSTPFCAGEHGAAQLHPNRPAYVIAAVNEFGVQDQRRRECAVVAVAELAQCQ